MRTRQGILSAGIAVFLAGCTVSTGPAPVPSGPAPSPAPAGDASFASILARVEPVAEDMCRRRRTVSKCDFRIVLDDRPGMPANAFQTVDKNGRPILIVTKPLLDETRNTHEVAFVLGHEAAHHIQGHLVRTNQTAAQGAILAGIIVAASGGNAEAIQSAQNLGASVGARAYSKNFELEADALGTVIAYRAGYDPVKGAEFFARIPDPGDQFLGSHPPNADRQRVVREVAAQLK